MINKEELLSLYNEVDIIRDRANEIVRTTLAERKEMRTESIKIMNNFFDEFLEYFKEDHITIEFERPLRNGTSKVEINFVNKTEKTANKDNLVRYVSIDFNTNEFGNHSYLISNIADGTAYSNHSYQPIKTSKFNDFYILTPEYLNDNRNYDNATEALSIFRDYKGLIESEFYKEVKNSIARKMRDQAQRIATVNGNISFYNKILERNECNEQD